MEEKAIQLLDELAKKLGTTADQIIEIYRAQVTAEIVFYCVVLGLFVCTIYPSIKWINYAFDKAETDENWIPILVVTGFLLTIIYLCSALFLIGAARDMANLIMNPDYWVMTEIFKKIGL